MRKFLMLILVVVLSFPVVAEVQMPIQDMYAGLHLMNIADNYEGTAYGFNGGLSISAIDWILSSLSILEGVRERVRFGDYLGGYIYLDGASFTDSTADPMMIATGLSWGGQAAVALTSDINVGLRIYQDNRLYLLGGIGNDLGGASMNVTLMGRYKQILGEAGTEFGDMSGFSAGIRYLLGTDKYLGLKYESKQLTWPSSGGNASKLDSIGLAFGLY